MSVFSEVKQRVSALDAFRHYGIGVGSKGMCCCPFHNDRNPSMKVDSRYHCFACGADGDAIDFVANYYGLSLLDATRKLNDDFFLGISFGYNSYSRPKSKEQILQEKELARKREAEKAFDIIRRDAINVLSDYHRQLWEWKKEYAPKDINEEDADWHPFFVEALDRLDFINELLDALTFGDRNEQHEIMKTYEKEIKNIEKRKR
ncbi:CHC2 zinc finger domain-containing protein [Butyrivibrio sp. MB2005]|uniref:CHC2 zinc finger domain-containing protein n=1 Tax=Butyrivibrio sp. MB2005 TaxID=1280678 RepID=UPI00041D21F1|nr:CHC2 zinc finger domain-containing protein [Butyrivibrio sp. MB2005]